MNDLERQNILAELKDFHKKLKSYKRYINPEASISAVQIRYRDDLREKLVNKSGVLKTIINELTGKQYYTQFGRVSEIWNTGLSSVGLVGYKLTGLGFCIDATNEAIGRLESDIKRGIRDVKGNLIEGTNNVDTREPPKTYENLGGKIVGNEFEVALLGTVDMTIECMMHFTKKLNSQGHSYKSNPRIGGHPDYANPDRTCFATVTIAEITETKEKQIGTIELQLIPDEKTLFKTSHPKEWDSSFKYFLDALFAEFEQLDFIKKEKAAIVEDSPPKAFIAHEGETKALDKLRAFLDALGVKYLIAEIEPSNGRLIEGQVEWTQGKADFAIILATKGKAVNKNTGKPQMGLNVADELGRARAVFKNRIILLLQQGVEPHTNIGGIVYEKFTPQSMDKAFTKVVRELKNWDFISVGRAEE